METENKPKVVQMSTAVPAGEEPVATMQVVACKSGAIYVGHAPGQEALAHQMCVDGATTLYHALKNKMAEAIKDKPLIQVAGNLEALGLGRRDS